MHRNTYLLVSALAVIAALVVGVNIGRQSHPPPSPISPSPAPPATPPPLATKPYRNAYCNVAFDYPSSLTVFENASGSAAFTGSNADDGILLTCQKNIPRPSVPEENTEELRIGSVSAKLYRDSVDTLIFRHPGTKLDVFLAGTGEVLRKLISTLILL